MTGEVLERVVVEGGEVRLLGSAVTEQIFEIELDGKLYRTTFDPRDTGTLLFVGFDNWTEPPDLTISVPERQAIIRAMSMIRGCDARYIVENVFDPIYEPSCYVLRHSESGEHLVNVQSKAIEYLELDRTMRLPYAEKSEPTKMVALCRREGAMWICPDRAPVTDSDWERALSNL